MTRRQVTSGVGLLGYATRMRDHLTPWLVVAILAISVMPLLLAGACDVACALGAMPAGACRHEGVSHSHSHSSGELTAMLPLIQQFVAAVTVLTLLMALTVAFPRPSRAVALAAPVEARAGTRMLN